MTIEITGKNFIAGRRSAQGNKTFSAQNPRTMEQSPLKFTEANKIEIDQMLHAAREAFGVVRGYPDKKVSNFLKSVAKHIEELGEQLINVCDWETALGEARLTGERGRTCNQLRMFADYVEEGNYKEVIIDKGIPNREPSPKPDIRRILLPLGPVGVFGASNFPLAFGIVGGDTASAWAAKCPVVAKGHPSHPQTSELLANAINEAIVECDFPKGFFSLIQGESIECGETLVKHPEIKAIGFTGSLRAGRSIYNVAAQRPEPIPVYAEMGSINPIFLMPSSLQEQGPVDLAQIFVDSITLGVGQFCTKPGVIILPPGDKVGELIENMKKSMEAKESGILLNARICSILEKDVQQVSEKKPVDVKIGGQREEQKISFENTLMVTTAQDFLEHQDLRSEKFGPVAILVKTHDLQQYFTIVDAIGGQLTGSIYVSDDVSGGERIMVSSLIEKLQYRVGRVIFNGVPTGVEVCHAMQHGGPYPATTAPLTTSVGMTAIERFLRPVAFQDIPKYFLPPELEEDNPPPPLRRINGKLVLEEKR